jgi:hypothetical protein
MGRPQAAAAHPVVSDQPDCVSVLYQGIFAGDFLVDRHQHFFLSQSLEEMAELESLSLDQLANRDRRGELAGEIPLSVRRLQLSRQDDRDHGTL